MPLLNLNFAILVVKIAICVLPGVLGLYLLAMAEEKKRSLRNAICNKLFGVSNAIPYPNFAKILMVVAVACLFFSAVASWFVLISKLV